MAGRLTVSTLNNDTGVLATQNGMTGIAKAWVNFAGASGTINGSFNVSSITKFGTGDFAINFTTSMPNVNYASVGGVQKDDGTNDANIYIQVGGYVGRAQSTTATYARVSRLDGFGSVDSPANYVAVLSS
jgi:hypothetical protein